MTFGFVITIFDEPQKQIDACVVSVRKVYPDVKIIFISDGGPDIIVPVGCGYVRGQHLKDLKYGGAWVHRLCEVGLTLNTDKVIKIDPDTRILRSFRKMPDADYFGEFMANSKIKINIIRGGCKGYSRLVMQRAFDEKWFLSDVFVSNNKFSYKHKSNMNMLSEDQVTAWAMFEHGIALTRWPEVINDNVDDSRYVVKHRVSS